MKKIYTLLTLLFAFSFLSAQVSLPYSYDFDASNSLTEGWVSISDNFMTGIPSFGIDPSPYSSPNCWAFAGPMSAQDAQDQYLISPRFANATSDSVQISFKYAASMGEHFSIGYCTSNSYNDINDFSWQSECVSADQNFPLTWQDYSVNVPAGAQYIVIHYYPDVEWGALLLDNILIRPNISGLNHSVIVNYNAGGTVTPGAEVADGDPFTLDVVPDQGYRLSSVTLDGVSLSGAANSPHFTYTIESVLADHTFEVVFTRIQYSIMIASGEHGTVVPDGGALHQILVYWGSDTTFQFLPDAGYHVEDVLVDDIWHGGNIPSYTFTNVQGNHTISVSFATNEYTIVAAAGVGGTITPSGNVGVQGFSNQSFVITPNPGYLIDTVYIDGVDVSAVTPSGWTYTFNNIQADHTISVVFARQQYLVTYTHSVGGSLTVTGGEVVDDHTRRVYYEDVLTFVAQADEGYQFSDIQVNGSSVGAITPYVLDHVLAVTTVHADFELLTYSVQVVKHGQGTVSPMSAIDSSYFSTTTFALTPSYCSQLDSVLLDGVPMDVSQPCELSHLVGNHQLDVYFSSVYYPMTIAQTSNGSLTGPDRILCDGTGYFNITPDHCSQLVHFQVDGVTHDEYLRYMPNGIVGVISNCDAPHTISAIFEQIQYQVNVSATGDGTVSYLGNNTLPCGSSLDFVVVPDDCHYVSALIIDHQDVTETVSHSSPALPGLGDTLRFSFDDLSASHTVEVTFTQFEYTLDITSEGSGYVVPEGAQAMYCSDSQGILVAPMECHQIAAIYIDSAEITDQLTFVDGATFYTFNDIREDHTLHAVFEPIFYTIHVDDNEHVSFSSVGDSLVECGGDYNLTITPDACYQVDTVWIDGVDMTAAMERHSTSYSWIGDALSYSFADVSDNHIVTISLSQHSFLVHTEVQGPGRIVGTMTDGEVECGTALHFEITPDDCAAISRVLYNGDELHDYQVDAQGRLIMNIASLHGAITLVAEFEPFTYNIMPIMAEHGEIQYDPTPIVCGDDIRIFFAPDPCYHIDSVRVDGTWFQPSQLETSETQAYYDILNVRSNPEVTAHFSIDSVRFVVEGEQPLSVSDTMLACGQPLTSYLVLPDCSRFDSIRVNGIAFSESTFPYIGSTTWHEDTLFFTFPSITFDYHCEVFTSLRQYIVDIQTDDYGSVSIPVPQQVACGSDLAMTIIPDACHQLRQVVVDGGEYLLEDDSLLILNNIRNDYSIRIFFEQLYFDVVATETAYGETVMEDTHLLCGTDVNVKFEPTSCGQLDSVWLDGQCVNDQLDTVYNHISLSLFDLHASHHVHASFVPRIYEIEVIADEDAVLNVPLISEVECDSTYHLHIAYDDCHVLSDLLVNGIAVSDVVQVAENQYDFEIPSVHSDAQITLVSHLQTFEVKRTVVYGTNTIEEVHSTISCGEDTTLSGLWADDCFTVTRVRINEVDTTILPEYLFEHVTGDIALRIDLQRNTYHIDVQEVQHCEISSESAVYSCGETKTFYFTPEEGWCITGVVVDGVVGPAVGQYEFTDIHADHTLSVEVAQYTYVIHTEAGDHGAVSPINPIVSYGSDQTVQILPDDCYLIDSVFVNGQYVGTASSYTFENVQGDSSLYAVFAMKKYPITANQTPGGQITPSGVSDVDCDGSLTYQIVPDPGYYIDHLKIDGEQHPAQGAYTFFHVRNSHAIEADFSMYEYMVSVTSDGNGLVSPQGDMMVRWGEDLSVTIVPNECFHIDSVFIDGIYAGNPSSYTFTHVTGAHTLHATFAHDIYDLNVTCNAGGEVVPSGHTAVECGDYQIIAFIPDSCHTIVDVLLDGVSVPFSDNSLTINNIVSDHDIKVIFQTLEYQLQATAGAHGSVVPAGDSMVLCGQDLTYAIVPDDCYEIASVTVNGETLSQITPAGMTYTFQHVGADATLSVDFVQSWDTIQVIAGEHGTVSYAGENLVACGDDFVLTLTPDECYRVERVRVDGINRTSWLQTDGDSKVLTLSSIDANHEVIVSFAPIIYTVQATTNLGGYVDPMGALPPCGTSMDFAVIPYACYAVDSVFINDVHLPFDQLAFQGDTAFFSIPDIREDEHIYVKFRGLHYQLDVQNHGTGIVAVEQHGDDCDGDWTFSIAPTACERISRVVLDGVDITGDLESHPNVNPLIPDSAVYTIHNVLSDQTLVIDYEPVEEKNITMRYEVAGVSVQQFESAISCGSDTSITISLDCHTLVNVSVNGLPVEMEDSVLVLSDIIEDQVVVAVFAPIEYQITSYATAGGTITPLGSGSVTCDSTRTFTILPDEGYDIAYLEVDGVQMPAQNSYSFTNVNENHFITAYFTLQTFAVEITSGEGGSVTPSGTVVVNYGDSLVVDIAPADCYRIDSIWANGENIAFTTRYVFPQIAEEQTLHATFAPISYVITSNAGEGGNITPAGSVEVPCGGNQNYVIAPDEGYYIEYLEVDGVQVNPQSVFNFHDVRADHTISAVFAIHTYTVDVQAGENGASTPMGAVVVDYGDDLEVNFISEDCYQVDSVYVNGMFVGTENVYSFHQITDNQTIRATFAQREYTLTATAGEGGTVSPSGNVSIDCGNSQTYTVVPDEGYDIAYLEVDGQQMAAADSYTFADVREDHTFAAYFTLRTFMVEISAGEGGNVTPNGTVAVNYGDSLAVSITPDDCFDIASVGVNGESVAVTDSYVFHQITENQTLDVAFLQREYTLTATAGEGGTITPAGATSVSCGDSQTFTVIPDEGYEIAYLEVDGMQVEAADSYTFADVRENHTFATYFTLRTFTVEITGGAGGNVTPNGTVAVNYGDSLAVSITPDDCYDIASVVVNGESVAVTDSYVFHQIAENQTFEVSFIQREYTLTATGGEGGTITPAGATTVNCGNNQTYTVVPDEGYEIAYLEVDGVQMEAADSYTFEDVRHNHTFAAYFTLRTFIVEIAGGAGGNVTPNGSVMVNYGDSLAVSITPADCYDIASVVVNGENVAATDTYVFYQINENQTLDISFAQREYTLTATSSAGGSISPNHQVVLCGTNATFTITPQSCYVLDSLFVDGEYMANEQLEFQGDVAVFTLSDIRQEHQLYAQFRGLHYQAIVQNHGAGEVSVLQNDQSCDGDWLVTILPATCDSISQVTLNGVDITNLLEMHQDTATYTIQNVMEDQVIVVDYETVSDKFVNVVVMQSGQVVSQNSFAVHCNADTAISLTYDCSAISTVSVNGQFVVVEDSMLYLNDIVENQDVVVELVPLTYTLSALAGMGGHISPVGLTTVSCDGNLTYTITPDEGYEIVSLVVDGAQVPIQNSYTFSHVRANHTFAAYFTLQTFTVEITAGAGGNVTPNGTVTVNYGDSLAVSITPADCFDIASVVVNGESIAVTDSHVFHQITENQTLDVTFAQREYTLTATAGVGGAVTPSGATTVACGNSQTYTIVPDEGYDISYLEVDGVQVEAADSYTFADVRDNHTFAAYFTLRTFTVEITAGEGGNVTPNGTVAVNYGDSLAVSITPADCYDIASVVVNGESIAVTDSYVFHQITENQTLDVTFIQREYTLTATAGEGGSVTPAGATTVLCGNSQTYTVVPDEGYDISYLEVDGVQVEAADSYTFADVRDNHTFAAYFTLRTFTVEITAGEGGNVTPNGTVAVNYGDSLSVSITPADCYDIASVVVNGESIAATDSYVFRQITENQTLDVMFAQREYTLTATAGEGGTVTPAGATTVACGNSQTYTVVPDEGYEIAYLMVDGDSVAAAGSYTFSDVRDDHTFEAYFTLKMFTVEITAGEGGNVTPNGTLTVNYGDSLAVSIVPDDCYEIASIVVNGDNIGITDSYVFYQITENQTLDVVFAPTFYAVTLDVYMNGELVLSDSMSVECGTDTSVYVPEFDCFEVVSLEVNGESVDVENPIEITDVRNNYHVVAELMAEQYHIVSTTQGQGTLTPADTSWVTCSSSITYTFTADTGWFVQELIVDGHSFGTPTSNTYTFPNVIANHTIEVIFALNEYIITSTVHPIDAGQINPYGTHIYTAGDSASYTIMAFPNYYIVDVQVDGVSVGSVSSYTFTNINENHTIEAFFATTDIEEAIENEVVVYAHEHTVYVRSEGIGRVREVEIYDMQGRRVVRQVGEGNEMQVDVPAAQGIYVVRVATTEGMLSRKVMITRR
jgi:hypothetical protein